jgi:hypothetical protein
MSQKDDEGARKSLGYVIQSQHPGITDEIQGAINTLRKLKKITGSSVVDKKVPPGAQGESDATVEHSSGADGDDADFVVNAPEGQSVPNLEAGESFGRYQISRRLGKGAMGAVYLAYDSQLQRYVALKTPFLGDNTLTIQRFYREARSTASSAAPTFVLFTMSGRSAAFISSPWPLSMGNHLVRYLPKASCAILIASPTSSRK